MGYILREGVHCCAVGDSFIFLDLVRDRYFALSGRAAAGFGKLVARDHLGDSDRSALAPLLDRGFLRLASPNLAPVLTQHASVAASFIDSPTRTSRPSGCAAALYHTALAHLTLKARPLAKILGAIERRKAAICRDVPGGAASTIEDVAMAFHRSGLLVGTHDQCLPRSIAMMSLLIGRGIQSDLVIGVMDRPFRAHCWVQHGTTVLNDRLDRVRHFTPILVV